MASSALWALGDSIGEGRVSWQGLWGLADKGCAAVSTLLQRRIEWVQWCMHHSL